MFAFRHSVNLAVRCQSFQRFGASNSLSLHLHGRSASFSLFPLSNSTQFLMCDCLSFLLSPPYALVPMLWSSFSRSMTMSEQSSLSWRSNVLLTGECSRCEWRVSIQPFILSHQAHLCGLALFLPSIRSPGATRGRPVPVTIQGIDALHRQLKAGHPSAIRMGQRMSGLAVGEPPRSASVSMLDLIVLLGVCACVLLWSRARRTSSDGLSGSLETTDADISS